MPTGIYKRVKENSGVFKKGQVPWNKGKKGIIPWNKGKKTGQVPWNKGKIGVMPTPWNKKIKMSKDFCEKIRQSHLGKKLGPMSDEHKKRISESNTGKKRTDELKELISKRNKGYKHTPEAIEKIKEAGTGRILSEETRQKIGDSHRGEKSVSWLGGSHRKKYPMNFNRRLKEYIRSRYDFKCAICGGDDTNNNKELAVHHINYIRENINEDNLIALCASCHTKTNRNRDYWQQYFKDNYALTNNTNISGETEGTVG